MGKACSHGGSTKTKERDNQSIERFIRRDYSRRSCSFGSARGDSKQGSSKMPACEDDLSMSGFWGMRSFKDLADSCVRKNMAPNME
jgi:hypothetical protein